MSENNGRVWVVTLHRFEHDEGSGGILEWRGIRVPVGGTPWHRHREVARLDGDLSQEEVARFMERWYAEHYQPGWTEGAEIEERAVMFVGGDIEVGHEPKLGARLVEDPDASPPGAGDLEPG